MNFQTIDSEGFYQAGRPKISHPISRKNLFPGKQVKKIMKLLSLIITICCLQASAIGLGQGTITLKVSNQPVSEVLKMLRKQVKMQFVVVDPELKGSTPVTLNLTNVTMEEALQKLFENQPYTYTITDKVIVIKKRPTQDPDPAKDGKTISVTGKVLNDEGEPVPSASIRIKGTNEGTTTNENGVFSIKTNDNAILVISGVNIETMETSVNGREKLTVFAKTQVSPLEEVVSKGYYKEKKLTSVGNVSKVSGDELRRQPIGNPLIGLQGRVPGLEVTQISGVPGKAPTLRIRGRNSLLSGLNPLYVIDGVPQYNGVSKGNSTLDNQFLVSSVGVPGTQFYGLSSADIESIEILKDADATAIYGSRGANGVILITTKKAKAGPSELRTDFAMSFGISQPSNRYDLLFTKDYLQMRKEAYQNDRITNIPSNAYDINGTWDSLKYTDWQKELLGSSAKYYDVQASISGNSGNINYLLGINYHKEETPFIGTFSDERKSLHLNLNHLNRDKRLSMNFSLLYSINKNTLPSNDLTAVAISLPPNAPNLYNGDGSLNWENGTWTNPLSYLYRIGKGDNSFLNANLELGYRIIKNLNIKVNLGYNTNNLHQNNIVYKQAYEPDNIFAESENSEGFSTISNFSTEPILEYKAKINQINIQALVGASYAQQEHSYRAVQGIGFTSDELIENVTSASKVTVLGVRESKYKYAATFARLNFNHSSKYLVNLTARRDGSSRFGPNRRYSNFYSLGAGWVFTNEEFLKNAFPVLSYGKLRGSYGTTGNDQIGDYQYLETYSTNINNANTYYGMVAMSPSRLVNPVFSWEKVQKTEGGLELGLLNDKLMLSFSYFYNKSSNQLLSYKLPITTGFTSVISNIPAEIVNRGLEIETTIEILKNKALSWKLTGNITFLKNELTKYDDLPNSPYASEYVVGEPLSILKRYEFNGVNRSTGLYQFKDLNNDGRISSLDRLYLVDPSRDLYGGISNTLNYKRFSLLFTFQFVHQPKGIKFNTNFAVPGSMFNQPSVVMERWRKEGDSTTIQKFTTSGAAYNRYILSNAGYENASFIRLKTLVLSYDIIKPTQRPRTLSQLTIQFQAQNLFTITGYNGLDPENQGLFPPLKTYVFALKAGF
ncbi:SusC/RagA family TonB-linked outer membrane protein [Paraflavitalea sp. CAU 1676]|uniref:SusC/RagA family TonB-linked outer membrane protein n=1 Tax=Paraflavitalea sp. CAU 1676 TaxID=3032598 RepID=UPI0023D9DB80|nr:SusC/RagA family TonB-linked outer membrane protein [Paraflavitalea sp. CAU 1676]MDF2190536.1 SusC/RagA family TonB-linked outer membrane protein [Paraflavitalea sp. CAU 1676]